MAIRGDSYSSVAEVTAYTRHLLDGEAAFNDVTRPSLTEVEKFIDRASGVLNMAIWQAGFNPTNVRANSTAKLPCDDWVTNQAAKYVELTQRGTGWSDEQGSRLAGFNQASAYDYVMDYALGWKRLGITVTDPVHQGLTFTALEPYDDRADPDDTGLEQPHFRRAQWDNT